MEYTAETLYERLSNILSKSDELKELGLRPIVGEAASAEAAPYILLENRGGIPLKYVTTIYKYSWEIFIKLRNLNSEFEKEDISSLDNCMKCLLVINPECYSAWNLRKRLIQEEKINPDEDLLFLELLFTFPQHNKSYTSWHHRKWVIELISARTSRPPSLKKEIDICSRVGELYPKNYNAWVHRQWILKYTDSMEALLEELERVKSWNNSHISDHSGFHHREQVLLRICQQLGILKSVGGISRMNLLQKSDSVSQSISVTNADLVDQKWLLELWLSEFQYIKELLTRYPQHETLWYHLRFCYFHWRSIKFEEVYIDEQSSTDNWPSLRSEEDFVERIIQLNSHDSDLVTYPLAYKLYILELHRQDTQQIMVALSKHARYTNYYAAQQ
ncbi:Protein prenyltransferase alpha subunit repeat-containing protein 1 [Basidiobolus ranarum]|uniref:Protein prenyltransferase alpha subunit repeat-containing protein 1 n=1 Tax=Basidiobolus ranarum TaxID=34480 RepID=A0ABR2WI88_9FUNG